MPSLAHRGRWLDPSERNSLRAFAGAFSRGLGVELDVRDLNGTLVISHDPPAVGALALDAVIDAYRAEGCEATIAVNVKADGLSDQLAEMMSPVGVDHWFAFDMSVPDTVHFARAGLPFFTRHSDLEPVPALYDRAAGVWLDDFSGDFVEERLIHDHVARGKRVAVVSPELHGRDHAAVWPRWSCWDIWGASGAMLCTDHPDDAEGVFA